MRQGARHPAGRAEQAARTEPAGAAPTAHTRPGVGVRPRTGSKLEFFYFYIFFDLSKIYVEIFFFKNVTQPPVHPAEGCYRRMNRR